MSLLRLINPMLWLRNDPIGPVAEAVAQRIIAGERLKIIEDDGYQLTIECDGDRIQFWNANRPYAWFTPGTCTKADGAIIRWRNQMPKRTTQIRLERKIASIGVEFL